ncbi:UV radiation resistance associated protein-like [Dendronephthya gigantea]|uniref:UV radiation resistance associated protein-like n=1 Tax=Dendronephthya gigantea TaxID=151771 RepID=UPI00106B454A|nr:UV radiation resistance associated protein-like [Dendronephthya gigantea]
MNARDNLHRRKHVELSSQQRRLRHVTSISARNVTPRKGFSNLNQLGTYFTLHLNHKAFYTSEIKASFNPTWQSFDISQLSEDLNTSSNSFIVRVWGGENGNFQLLIEWSVDLNGLTYLDDIIRQDGDSYEPNSLIFGLQDGYYVAPKEGGESDGKGNLSNSLLKVDQELVKSPFNLSSLHRLHTLVRAIRQTQIQIRLKKMTVQENLRATRQQLLHTCERDRLKLSVNMLREELRENKKMLLIEQTKENDLTDHVRCREDKLGKRMDGFESVRKSFAQARKTYFAKRENLVKTNAQLLMRRKQLCHELTYIYPIELSQNKETVVCGLPLPNTQSPAFNAANEESLSSAFGYVCHMVSMIGRYFSIPLRYPAKNKGSRSTVTDFVNDRIQQKDREFPLYVKGKEKIQFEFGVFLLNKNIAQIRLCLGLTTSDLRLTLPNVKSLFDTKFGGSSPYHSRPISVITPPVSPPPEQEVRQDQKGTPESNTEQLDPQQEESVSSDDYIVPQSDVNGTALKTLLPIKPQTNQHKFLAAGHKKSLSSGSSFAQKRETPNNENPSACNENLGDFPECELQDTTSTPKETVVDTTHLPDVKVEHESQIDRNIENLFNV